MRTERALKLRLNQAKNRLEYSRGNDIEILLGEINLLEWILNLDKRSMYLKRLANKNKQI
jgi:hypothetical protein